MKTFALIVAGGNGSRMGTNLPKQFIKIAGKPILLWTIERFISFDSNIKVVLVLPENQFETWENICTKFQFNFRITIAKGGNTRFQSVKNGLAQIHDDGIVFIHDGVRPLVSQQTIKNCFQLTVKKGNALPVTPLIDSIRKINGKNSSHKNRNEYRLVQTPQTFQTNLIKNAYLQHENDSFTDDASVLEKTGTTINLVKGNSENLKITTPTDLRIAELFLAE